MKKNIFMMLVILVTTYANSQNNDFVCATPDNYDPDPEEVYSYSTDPIVYKEGDPMVLNVFYWQVKGPNGEYNGDFTEDKVLESVAFLNIAYNQFNIFFKYRGYDAFNSPNDVVDKRYEDGDGDGDLECVTYPDPDPTGYAKLDRCQIGSLWSFANNQGYRKTDAINIYVPYQTVTFGGAAQGLISTMNIVPLGNLNKTSFIHEIGHNLGLRHTTQNWRNNDNPGNPCIVSTCERVTRDVNNSEYNAHCKGDRITDTNAVPNFKREDYYNLIDQGFSVAYAEANYMPYRYINENCEYTGDGTDCQTNDYTITPEDVINTMLPALPCDDYNFTPGQGIYMRETIAYATVLQNVLTDVPSLYEPYKGEYPAYYPYPASLVLPLFQPGFNYFFVECDGEYPEPAPFNESFYYDLFNIIDNVTSSETNYSSITHPNHTAIYIKPVLLPANVDAFSEPQKCYNNYNSPPIIGGSVITFNDGVLNTNVTITAQDSTAINNEQLIDNLQPGLYNVIKNYQDGHTEETVILKENN